VPCREIFDPPLRFCEQTFGLLHTTNLHIFMRPYIVLALLCVAFATATAQEFAAPPGGLIYSDSTMRQLRHITDSLHLRYRVCDPNPRYHACWQATGHSIQMEPLSKKALADLKRGMGIGEFMKKYPKATVDTQVLAVAIYNHGDKRYDFYTYPTDNKYLSLDSSSKRFELPKAGHLSVRMDRYGRKAPDLKAFIFTSAWKSQEIPLRWAKALQYGECMVDTNTTVYLSDRTDTYLDDLGEEEAEKTATPANDRLKKMMVYADQPTYESNDTAFHLKVQAWQAARMRYFRDTLSKRADFVSTIQEAFDESMRLKRPSSPLEEMPDAYLTPRQRLDILRLRRVWGTCSHDDSPRLHALNIAISAANAGTWEVFLRAHLDIMNDRFPRMTDGSYAWGRRGTYINELEALDLDLGSLLPGILFRADGLAINHYYGSPGRIGRAVATSTQKDALEAVLAAAAADPALDDFNRLLVYYTLRNFLAWKSEQEDGPKINGGDEVRYKRLLPTYLAERL
jgi:hypothetical protein